MTICDRCTRKYTTDNKIMRVGVKWSDDENRTTTTDYCGELCVICIKELCKTVKKFTEQYDVSPANASKTPL